MNSLLALMESRSEASPAPLFFLQRSTELWLPGAVVSVASAGERGFLWFQDGERAAAEDSQEESTSTRHSRGTISDVKAQMQLQLFQFDNVAEKTELVLCPRCLPGSS